MSWPRAFAVLLIFHLLIGCAGAFDTGLPTPLPAEYLPTAVALTRAAALTATAAAPTAGVPTETPTPSFTPTLTALPSPTDTAPTEAPQLAAPSLTPTPASVAPPAEIQIFRPGDLSKVISPLRVIAYLKPGSDGKVWVELYGEDGRLLVRQIKVFYAQPGARVNLALDLDFQIAAVAEAGRLVIRVNDEAGRAVALNSIDLILLSLGEADITPGSGTQAAIIIQQPGARALVQGGTLLVTGLARVKTDRALSVQLVTAEGRVVGQRLAGLTVRGVDGYAGFAAEIPYQVSTLTPVRLVVFEDGQQISPITHLSSVEINLSP